MEMNSFPNQNVEDQRVKTQRQCSRRSFAVLMIASILTTSCGCLFIMKLIVTKHFEQDENLSSSQLDNVMKNISIMEATINTLEKKVKTLLSLPHEADVVQQKIHQNESSTSQLNIQILDIKKHMEAMEAANNALESKVTILLSLPHEADVVQQRIHQNEPSTSQLNIRISDLKEHMEAMETTNNALKNKITTFVNKTSMIEKLISQLVYQNISSTDKEVADVMKRTQAIEAANHNLEKKITAHLNITHEMEKIREQLNQGKSQFLQLATNISDTAKKVSDMIQRAQAVDAVYKDLEKNFSDFLPHTLTTGKVIWKLDEYRSRIGEVTHYGPTFYTSPFGYKIQLVCTLKVKAIHTSIRIVKGEYDDLLKWPFAGHLTFTIYDQSQEPDDIVKECIAPSECNKCTAVAWEKPINENPRCGPEMVSIRDPMLRNFIKNDTLYLGVKIESSSDLL